MVLEGFGFVVLFKMDRYIDDHPELQGALMDTGEKQFYIVRDFYRGRMEIPVGSGPTEICIGHGIQRGLDGIKRVVPVYRIFEA